MSIKIVLADKEVDYNPEIPLEEQVQGSKKIVIDYKPNDTAINTFLDQVERVCAYGINCNLNIQVRHNNTIGGARIKAKTKKLEQGIQINELIKFLELARENADRQLEEMAKFCLGKECSKRQYE